MQLVPDFFEEDTRPIRRIVLCLLSSSVATCMKLLSTRYLSINHKPKKTTNHGERGNWAVVFFYGACVVLIEPLTHFSSNCSHMQLLVLLRRPTRVPNLLSPLPTLHLHRPPATCLYSTLLFCSLCMYMPYRPFIIILPTLWALGEITCWPHPLKTLSCWVPSHYGLLN